MAAVNLKTLHLPSHLSARRPGSSHHSVVGPSQHSSRSFLRHQPNPPPRLHLHAGPPAAASSSSSKKHRRATAPLPRCAGDEVAVRAPEDQDQAAENEIPIVAHPSVVFPGATLQLQTFEFRHRIMVHTLLQQGLSFGVVCSAAANVVAAGDVGCVVHVLDCERLVDGRFFLTCVAGDRFRVLGVARTKPFAVARIQVLDVDDDQPARDDTGTLMRQVERHLRNVAALSDKLGRKRRPPWGRDAEQLRGTRSAASFSFLVARLFIDDRLEQQALLEMDDTAQRLAREGMYLERRSKYLAAVAAIKDAFQHISCNDL